MAGRDRYKFLTTFLFFLSPLGRFLGIWCIGFIAHSEEANTVIGLKCTVFHWRKKDTTKVPVQYKICNNNTVQIYNKWWRKLFAVGILEPSKIPFLLWVSFFIILLVKKMLSVQCESREHAQMLPHSIPEMFLSALLLAWSGSWKELRNWTCLLEFLL